MINKIILLNFAVIVTAIVAFLFPKVYIPETFEKPINVRVSAIFMKFLSFLVNFYFLNLTTKNRYLRQKLVKFLITVLKLKI
jgi:hypothetical protein